jgi:hypothetical protein
MSKSLKNCFFPFHQQHFSTIFLPNFFLVLNKCPKTKLQRSKSQIKGKKSHPREKRNKKTQQLRSTNKTISSSSSSS